MYINQPAHWSDTWVRLKMGSECRQLWPFQYRGMMNRGANWDEDRNCGNLEPVRLWFLCLTWFSLHWNVPQAVLFLVDQLLDGENHSFTFALRRSAQESPLVCVSYDEHSVQQSPPLGLEHRYPLPRHNGMQPTKIHTTYRGNLRIGCVDRQGSLF